MFYFKVKSNTKYNKKRHFEWFGTNLNRVGEQNLVYCWGVVGHAQIKTRNAATLRNEVEEGNASWADSGTRS